MKKLFSGRKKTWGGGIVAAILAVSAFYYWQNTQNASAAVEEETLQTASVRQGDIFVSATGTGSLIPAYQVNLAFDGNGKIVKIAAEVGDNVEEGQLLARLDDTLEQISLIEAERTYKELTSPASIAEAKETLLEAQRAVYNAENELAYAISPNVYYWEKQKIEAEQALAEAQTDEEKEQAQKDLTRAESNILAAWSTYFEVYVPEYFTVTEIDPDTREEIIYTVNPSQLTIDQLWNQLELAQIDVIEAEYYLQALTEGEIPPEATGEEITKLEQAQLNLLKAQLSLQEKSLYAPTAGTVIEISAQVGDTPGSSPVFTIVDLSQYYLEIFLDETDFDKIDVGYEVEVIFDVYPDDVFTGEVVRVVPQLTSLSGSPAVQAYVALESTPALQARRLQIGSNALVDVIAGRAEDVIVIPIEALREITPGEYAVFVVEDGEPKLRLVEVGLIDITYAEITSGLEVGETVTTGIVEVE